MQLLSNNKSASNIGYADKRTTLYDLNGNIENQASGSVAVVYDEREMKGKLIPDFKRRVSEGELLPHTPYDYTSQLDVQDLGGELTIWNATNGNPIRQVQPLVFEEGYATWRLTSSEFNDTPFSEGDLNYLVQEAAARIYSKGHDTLTFLAEANQLHDMLFNFSNRLVDLARGKSWERLGSLWLEGRYGWRTLQYDLVDIHEAIVEFDAKRHRYSERAGDSTRDVRKHSEILGSTEYQYHREITWTTSISRRGSITADIEPPRFRFNPVITAWEKTRYSFMIDWVIDVGRALEAMSFDALASKYYASYGYEIVTRKAWRERDTDWFLGKDGIHRLDTESVRTVRQRIPTTLSLVPQLSEFAHDPYKVLDLSLILRKKLASARRRGRR